jgi:Protein of unknown function (DUF2924)
MYTRLTAPRRENHVEETIEQEIAELSRMTVGQLKQKYIEVFGEETRSNNRQFLFRRIAWRIQALAEGGLSERARRRALEIANDADIRVRAPNKKALDPEAFLKVTARLPKPHDSRLPPPGAWLERNFRGQRIAIKVRIDGFEFEGRVYKTLTTAVNRATGGMVLPSLGRPPRAR